MSKASEWAAKNEEIARASAQLVKMEWLCPSGGSHVMVDQNGEAVVRVSDYNWARWTPEEACALAAWLLDTFGDAR